MERRRIMTTDPSMTDTRYRGIPVPPHLTRDDLVLWKLGVDAALTARPPAASPSMVTELTFAEVTAKASALRLAQEQTRDRLTMAGVLTEEGRRLRCRRDSLMLRCADWEAILAVISRGR